MAAWLEAAEVFDATFNIGEAGYEGASDMGKIGSSQITQGFTTSRPEKQVYDYVFKRGRYKKRKRSPSKESRKERKTDHNEMSDPVLNALNHISSSTNQLANASVMRRPVQAEHAGVLSMEALQDPGIWLTTREIDNEIVTGAANVANYKERLMCQNTTLDTYMDNEYKQLGPSATETVNLTNFNNVIMQFYQQRKFHFKNNYAYTVLMHLYDLTAKTDSTSADNPIASISDGIADRYQGTTGNEDSVLHYPEHSIEFNKFWRITKKKYVRIMPGESFVHTIAARGFYNQDIDEDLNIQGVTRCLLLRITGDIAHDAEVETACGYSPTQLDLVKTTITTFRFFNAGKQQKYDFISETLGTAARQVAAVEHEMNVDEIAEAG